METVKKTTKKTAKLTLKHSFKHRSWCIMNYSVFIYTCPHVVRCPDRTYLVPGLRVTWPAADL